MNILLVCCVAVLTTGVAVELPVNSRCRECLQTESPGSSTQACRATDAEASGVVLLVKRAALSRASFKDAELSETKQNSSSIHTATDQISTIANSPRLQPRYAPSALLSLSILHVRDSAGLWLILGLLFLCVGVVILWRYRQQVLKDQEIYGEEEGDWQHESWVKRYRPPPPLEDSPVPTPILPRATNREQQRQNDAILHQYRRQHPGSAQSLSSASSIGGGTAAGSAANLGSAGRLSHHERLQVAATEKFEATAELAQETAEQLTEKAIEGVEKSGDAAAWIARKGYKKIDKKTGKTLTKLQDRVETSAAQVQHRWNEARADARASNR